MKYSLHLKVKSSLTSACTRLPTARFINHTSPANKLLIEGSLAGPAAGNAQALGASLSWLNHFNIYRPNVTRCGKSSRILQFPETEKIKAMWWKKSDRNGVFIYGDGPKDAVPVIWNLSYGKELSNKASWRAGVLIDVRGEPVYQDAGPQILLALKRQFVFKLQIENGTVYPCGIYDLDDFSAYGADIYAFVICSRDQPMEYVK